jgi:peroxiredoxin
MKFLSALSLLFALAGLAFGQNEQSPITEKPFAYKDWTYKNLKNGGETNLREFAKGKKLVMVVYWAPWCPNWKHDVAFVQSLHEKYKDAGLGIIGVGEYDSTGKMKDFTDQNKVTFPTVYESENSSARVTTVHYSQRTEAGDTRKWGSPWYVILDPAALEQTGQLTLKTTVVNGELIKQDAEKYIQQKLGVFGSTK